MRSEVKNEWWVDHVLLPFILGCCLVALFMWATGCDGAITDCIDATCRVSAADGGMGTGVVFTIEGGRVYVMTNAHVATSILVKAEFWKDGHLSKPVTGHTVLRVVSRDVAVIAIDAALFGRHVPKAIPLAKVSKTLYVGETVTSVGCSGGVWATAFRGHVRGFMDDGRFEFDPTPASGRSGSAIFDAKGEVIVGLLQAQRLDKPKNQGGKPIWGIAIDIENIYASVYGARVSTRYNVKDRALHPMPELGAQCGPRGCPTPQQGRGYVLPYRQKQQQIDRRQDREIGDLYPTRPFEVAPLPDGALGAEVKLPVEGRVIAIKKRGLGIGHILFMSGAILSLGAIGGLWGLVAQWKASHRK